MLDKSKTDPKLGIKINDYLEKKGVQTPLLKKQFNPDAAIDALKICFEDVLKILKLDLKDDSLSETPKRIAKMYVNELFWGLRPENFPKATAVENKMYYNEMIIEKNIKVNSVCEHHFVTIWGKAHIAYIPKRKVLGLSKLNRIVEYFCRRPQIQERLTEQIFYALEYILETSDIAVVIDAEHFCVKSRGVEDIDSNTVTSKMGGVFMRDENTRKEFINLIKFERR